VGGFEGTPDGFGVGMPCGAGVGSLLGLAVVGF